MNILVIKQTSLGDVLHATGHVRAIKKQFPECHLTLLTADTSAAIFAGNPHVDEIILFQRYRIKRDWWRHPLWTLAHFRDTLRRVRARRYDLAIDLQGRWKSVLFLYAARTRRRFVKGRWPLLDGFRDRHLHALVEMDRLLERAGIRADDTSMEVHTSADAREAVQATLRDHGWRGEPYLLVSPFTRWPSKNWSVSRYRQFLAELPAGLPVVISGAAADRPQAEHLVDDTGGSRVINLCGTLELEQFAALVEQAAAAISGDSFAMHLAVACETPVVALFGPTAESRVGPKGERCICLRADAGCDVCYRRDCRRRCIDAIEPGEVIRALESLGVVEMAQPVSQ